MSVQLKVDHREGKLKDLFGESATYENLVHGDIQVLVDGEILLVFERKTTDDLLASIKDGRYKNQKAVLFQSGYKPSQIYYIIEGNIKLTATSKSQKPLVGALINTMLRDKICTMITRGVDETYALICDIFERVKADPDKYKNPSVAGQIITMTQGDKITPEICFRNQLCQIPDVSEKTASAVMGRFSTMKSLILELHDKDKEILNKELAELKTDSGRKISSKAAKNIVTYMFL